MKTVGIVYNNCFGGFSLSIEATEAYLTRKNISYTKAPSDWGGFHCEIDGKDFFSSEISRHDQDLVAVVNELGNKANGDCAKLRIEWVPSGTAYEIRVYDGNESVRLYGNFSVAI